MRRFSYLPCCLLVLLLSPSTFAVLGGAENPPATPGDSDYAAGLKAWENKAWQRVVEHMTKVIRRRPWDDNAHHFIGFAYRKLKEYPQALEHYHKALELNPYHRGALEYLGEAYLEMGHPAKAKKILEQLAIACGRTSGDPSIDHKAPDCPEWQTLETTITTHGQMSHGRSGDWTVLSANAVAALDTTTTQLSELGHFRVSFRSRLTPIAINQIHSWVLHLETTDGQPVEAADITLDGGMPEHNHGLPTTPQVTRYLGNGDYLVEGIKFHMNGWWQINCEITSGKQRDRVTFNLVL